MPIDFKQWYPELPGWALGILKGGCGEQAGKWKIGSLVIPPKRRLVAGRASNRKNKMAESADYICGDPKSKIKPPATPYINVNKARTERERESLNNFKKEE